MRGEATASDIVTWQIQLVLGVKMLEISADMFLMTVKESQTSPLPYVLHSTKSLNPTILGIELSEKGFK